MDETINHEVEDHYQDHATHGAYDEKCSECFKNVKKFNDDLEADKKEEPHPCRWCGTPTLNLECDACDKKNDEAYFERHGEDPFADEKQRDLLNDR